MSSAIPFHTSIAAILALSLTAAAQGPEQIVGWVNPGSGAKSGRIQIQDVTACKPEKTVCNGVLWPQNSIAGATAYDARHQSVWVSDGTRFEEWSLKGCKLLCKVKPLIMNSGAEITGLASAEAKSMLWQLESKPGYYGLLPYDKRKCPPVPLRGGCRVKLSNPRAIAHGLAYDEARNLLFYTVSEPGIVGAINTLFVAPAVVGKACQPICKFPVRACITMSGAITGLAYDACSQKLYLSDGRRTRVLQAIDPAKCQFKTLPCCAKQLSGNFRGLAVIPRWAKKTISKPCISKGCPFCSRIDIALEGGDPALGNRDFAIALHGGPLRALGVLYLGFGNCSGGIQPPFLCGKFYPALAPVAPLVLVAGPLSGPGQCRGSARVALPVPTDRALCKLDICAQWIVFCGAVVTHGMSPAIQFNFAG